MSIGERRKPQPEGKPGYIRIDTVHQGDQDKVKGVYHINAVDEVTQFEIVCSVEKISEQYLMPALEEMLKSLPHVERYLKSEITLEILDERAMEISDNEAADCLQQSRRKLFCLIFKQDKNRLNDLSCFRLIVNWKILNQSLT
ncbi:Integrase, catalytic region [hydrothermal vent metagenome]|uniref:Integrase, catalytic region n=1 Tax=hydrothermal vent metagenome TaxID=652676 RepID=A0A3B0WHC6_9ZZZZ